MATRTLRSSLAAALVLSWSAVTPGTVASAQQPPAAARPRPGALPTPGGPGAFPPVRPPQVVPAVPGPGGPRPPVAAAAAAGVAFATPNMLGDLLRNTHAVTFPYLLAGDASFVDDAGSVSLRSSKIAENNSAVPRSRVSYRYNWFHNATDVRGYRPDPASETFATRPLRLSVVAGEFGIDPANNPNTFPVSDRNGLFFASPQFAGALADAAATAGFREVADAAGTRTFLAVDGTAADGRPALSVIRIVPGAVGEAELAAIGAGGLPGNGAALVEIGRAVETVDVVPAEKSYDAHLHTFAWEQAFLEDAASLEVRLPYVNRLDSSLTLGGVETLGDRFAGGDFTVPAADATFGTTDFELGDVTLILKALVASGDRWALSSGLGLTLPTADDTSVTVVDGFADQPGMTAGSALDAFGIGGRASSLNNVRVRGLEIENETVALSPFLATAGTPTERTFVNGFLQFDLPVGQNSVRYTETLVDRFGEIDYGGPATRTGSLAEQYLLSVDVGGGYWLYRAPEARGVTGLASLLELHYTTTLSEADALEVRGTPLRRDTDGNGLITTADAFEPATVLGSANDRVDLVNATVGATAVFDERATFSLGAALPLTGGVGRAFDVEVQAQLNYYFDRLGGSSVRRGAVR